MIDWVATGGIAQILAAIGTGALAFMTWRTLELLRDQMVKSVQPSLILCGHWLLPESAQAQEAALKVSTQREPIEIENQGRGTALYVQWEVKHIVGGAESVRRKRVYLNVAVGEKKRIWQSTNQDGFNVEEGQQITLWYQDKFEHCYKCVFKPYGQQWKPTCSREKEPPPEVVDSMGI